MTVDPPPLPVEDALALERAWRRASGFTGWFREVNHQVIGRRYIVTAMIFFVLGGLEALAMRLQLARPENRLLNPDLYNQIFSMHGTTMMFLFAVPVMEGMAMYLVPLMVGTRNVAFPRLNAYGYFLYLAGGVFLYTGFLFNTAPDAGWFAYTPLSGPQYSPGRRVDFWAQMITFTEMSGLITAIEVIVTVLRQRAAGMSLNRMPLYVWSMFVQSWMVLFAMPSVMVASGMLLLDRTTGTHFFNPAEGGEPLLWQHLFWFFGHPEVYIIFIPALGFLSQMLPTFARRPTFGYTPIVLSQIATGFVGFGLWVHHMFATGLPALSQTFFTAASMMIAIPTGVQIFCFLATIWNGRPKWDPPMLYIVSFILTFVMGGLTGVMIAAVPFNLQAHDTFFIVAHFHYVLIGGAVFPLLGALHYWFPKMTGRMMRPGLARLEAAIVFVGFHLTFFPMHILGLQGMTRRVYTYLPETGWGPLNALATVGAFVLSLGVLLLVANVVVSLRAPGATTAGPNPWNAGTLEWLTTSPPVDYNFGLLPVVKGPYPLWDEDPATRTWITGVATRHREVLVTTAHEARPDHRYPHPSHSIWPFWLAVATSIGFAGSVFNMWWFVVGAVLAAGPLVMWFWPDPGVRDELETRQREAEGRA